MTDSLLASYEAAPYESRAITSSHIDTLATIARLRGLETAPLDRCRVLELGCASGGNLIPMAMDFPTSHFTGIDLAPTHIAEALDLTDKLGLRNLTFHAGSIADIDETLGEFDFIICHGVYSWVPPEVQEAILRVCSRNLASNGVAYVSYNAYPGWHVRMMVREMLLEHDDPTLSVAARLARARAFVDRLAAAGPVPPTLHIAAVREEARRIRGQNDSHLLHEQLEPFNAPVYFVEFIRRAARHGLQYLAETPLWETRPASAATLADEGVELGVIEAEQDFDYIGGRMFRRTLLCHDSVAVPREFDAAAVSELHMMIRADRAKPSDEDAARSPDVEAFRSHDGVMLTTNNPLVLAYMNVIGEGGPTSVSFADVLAGVRDRLRGNALAPVADDSAAVAAVLLEGARVGLIALQSSPSRFTRVISDRPVASPLARLQAPSQGRVTGMLHGPVRLSLVDAAILPLLDGEHDRRQLVLAVKEGLATGRIAIDGDTSDQSSVETMVEDALRRLRSLMLLVS